SQSAKVLATLARARTAAFPAIPTAEEQGLKDFDVSAWNAIYMPKAAPPAIVDKLNAAVSRVLDMPPVRKRLDEIGLIVVPPDRRSPAYLAKFTGKEVEKWAAPIKAAGVSAD